MKIKLEQYENYWGYNVNEMSFTQNQYDYIYKCLDFNKLNQEWTIHFNNDETKKWFAKTHTYDYCLDIISNKSPEGYKYLKNNWGNGVFKFWVDYQDKQKLKTIVNKLINIKLIRG